MPKFPEPPGVDALRAIEPTVAVLKAGTLLWRVYFRRGQYPTTWSSFRFVGPTSARFDHHHVSTGPHQLQDRGILYAAEDGRTCLAEVFQERRIINIARGTPTLVGFVTQTKVLLLDLTGTFPTRAGASMVINTGARPRTRRWAQQFYAAYPNLAGFRYASSMHGNAPAMALNERANAAEIMPPRPIFHRALSDPSMWRILQGAAAEIGYELI